MMASVLCCGVYILACLLSTQGMEENMDSHYRKIRLNQFIADDENYDREHRRRSLDQFDLSNSALEALKCDQSSDVYRRQVQSHIRRYINTFLRYSKLKDKKLSDGVSGEIIYTTLNIRIKAEDLLKLQNFYSDENVNISLLDLDVILSDVLYHSQLAQVEALSSWSWSWLQSFLPGITLFQAANASIVIASLYVWYFCGLRKMIPFVLIALTIVESVQKYLRALRNEEIKHYLRMKERFAYPPQCDPTKRSYWATFMNLIREDPCINMFHDERGDASENVSFIESFFNTHLFVFLELPLNSLGKAVAAMSTTLAGSGPYGLLIYPLMVSIVFLFITVGACVLSGFKFRAYSLLGGFEVGGTGEPSANRSQDRSSVQPLERRNESVPLEASSSSFPSNVVNIIMSKRSSRRRRSSKLIIEGQKPIYLPVDTTDSEESVLSEEPLPIGNPSSVAPEKMLTVEPDTPLSLALEEKPDMEDVNNKNHEKQINEGAHLITDIEETDGSTVDTWSDGSSHLDQLDECSEVDVLEEVKALRSEIRSFCDDEDDTVPELNEKS